MELQNPIKKNTNYLLVVQRKEAWVLFQAPTLQQWGKINGEDEVDEASTQNQLKSFPISTLDVENGRERERKCLGFAKRKNELIS